jgi:spermidine synthase
VVADLFHPAQDGAAFLYTREHFTAVRARLRPTGLFCQWLPLFQMDLQTFDSIAATFASVFPHTEAWLLRFNVDTPVVGLIGWNEPPVLPADRVETRSALSARLEEHLRTVALGDTLRLLGCRLGIPEGGSARLNTDGRPIVLFTAPRVTFQRRDDPAQRLLELIERYPVSDSGPLGRYQRARNACLRGLAAEGRGELGEAIRLYVESARISREFTSGYAQAVAIATAIARTNPEGARGILRELMEAQPERPVARQLLERLP